MFLGSGTPVMDKVVFWSVQKTGFFYLTSTKIVLEYRYVVERPFFDD